MLQQIRKTADGIVFRIFLGVIVLSFVAWGVNDVIKGPGGGDLATFKGIDPISYNDFAKAKAEEVKKVQRSEGINFSEEQIEQMGVNQFVLRRLIQNKLLDFLVKKYDLDFSDAVLADVIRTLPIFRDDSGMFDIERLKAYLRINNITEDDYSDEIKAYLGHTMILGSFVGNSYIPKVRVDNIIDHMSEVRTVDIASISLVPAKQEASLNVGEAELKSFYDENKDYFKTAEMRDICYTKIDHSLGKNKVTVTDQDIAQFLEENKTEFKGKNPDKIRAEAKAMLQKQKLDEWFIELAKSLEDEVAGGSTLQEISAKYGLKRVCEKNITAQNIETSAGGLFSNFSQQLSEMADQEVSYPIDVQGTGMVLFEIAKFIPEKLKEFESVKKEVLIKYQEFAYRQKILKNLQDFASKANSNAFSEEASGLGMVVSSNKIFLRSQLAGIASMPPEMLVSMFSADSGKVAGPFIAKDSAYMLVVRKIGYDKASKLAIAKEAKENIVSKIKEGMMEELLIYTQTQSNMKVKADWGK